MQPCVSVLPLKNYYSVSHGSRIRDIHTLVCHKTLNIINLQAYINTNSIQKEGYMIVLKAGCSDVILSYAVLLLAVMAVTVGD